MIDKAYVFDNLDTIHFEKVYKDTFFYTRYRIYKRNDDAYYLTRETLKWYEEDASWQLEEASSMFTSYKAAKWYLGIESIGFDVCSSWIERRQLSFYHFRKNFKEIAKNKLLFFLSIAILFAYFIYVIIGLKFIVGGLVELGIDDEHFLFIPANYVLGTIIITAPIIYFTNRKTKKKKTTP